MKQPAMSDSCVDKREGIKLKGGAFIATISVDVHLCENHVAPCYTILSQDVRVFDATMSCMHSAVTNLLQDVDDGMESRTTPIQEGEGDEDISKPSQSHLKAGCIYATSFPALQVISNSAATFDSDSTEIPARFWRYLPHLASKRGV
jgi:hypothetical protein